MVSKCWKLSLSGYHRFEKRRSPSEGTLMSLGHLFICVTNFGRAHSVPSTVLRDEDLAVNKMDKTFWPQGVPILVGQTDRQEIEKHLLEANKGYENKMSRLRDHSTN